MRVRVPTGLSLALLTVTMIGCGAETADPLCRASISVSGYIVDLSLGLDNRSEFSYSQFRTDTEDVVDVVSSIASNQALDDEPLGAATRQAAAQLAERLGAFVASMRLVGWDLSRSASRPEITEAWTTLVTPESLGDANVVEARIIDTCGLPSRATSVGDGPDRLPDPSIPSPLATDPPTAPVDQDSEDRALGDLVAALFGVTTTPNEALCLGRELSDVVDLSNAEANMAQYLGQFQRGFDQCGVDVLVPVS